MSIFKIIISTIGSISNAHSLNIRGPPLLSFTLILDLPFYTHISVIVTFIKVFFIYI